MLTVHLVDDGVQPLRIRGSIAEVNIGHQRDRDWPLVCRPVRQGDVRPPDFRIGNRLTQADGDDHSDGYRRGPCKRRQHTGPTPHFEASVRHLHYRSAVNHRRRGVPRLLPDRLFPDTDVRD